MLLRFVLCISWMKQLTNQRIWNWSNARFAWPNSNAESNFTLKYFYRIGSSSLKLVSSVGSFHEPVLCLFFLSLGHIVPIVVMMIKGRKQDRRKKNHFSFYYFGFLEKSPAPGGDSNPWPLNHEACALPLCLDVLFILDWSGANRAQKYQNFSQQLASTLTITR